MGWLYRLAYKFGWGSWVWLKGGPREAFIKGHYYKFIGSNFPPEKSLASGKSAVHSDGMTWHATAQFQHFVPFARKVKS